jgi:DNA phosphorothioation-dependent restriction protein DptG
MKKILTIIALCLISSVGFAKESPTDLAIDCRPIKESEHFRAFSLRLRETDSGYKLVKDSAEASPSFVYIKNLEIHPQVNVTSEKNSNGIKHIKEIAMFSGDEKSDLSAALKITLESNRLYYGRLQLWWPGQTSSLTEKVQCFLHDEWSNSKPVMP